MKEWKQLMNGELVDGEGKLLDVINPATGKVIASVPSATKEQTDYALKSAQQAFESWSKSSLKEREGYIRKLISLLNNKREEIKECLIAETGKSEGTADYDFQMLPDCLDFFIEEAKRMNDEMIADYEGKHMNMIVRKPLGVIACHLAWNFPILNIAYKLGPILASGCTCVLKPSSDTPLATMMVAEVIKEAGLPAGVVNIVVGSGAVVSQAMNESTIPSMITLIGSTETGKKIIQQSATSIKHYSLELGGNAPVVVMEDADAYAAGTYTADAKCGNSGQVCVCPNRIFVHEKVMDKFLTGVQDYMRDVAFGTGKDAGVHLVGPLVNEKALNRMEELVADAVEKGATVLIGGKRVEREGLFFEPTVLTNVNSTMRVYQEEIFGPIMPVLSFDDEADIVSLANDTEFGLAAYVYTKDLEKALYVSRNIDSGNVCVNEPFYSQQIPHGGCKQSGVGKDCSRISLEEYYTIQRISVKY